MYNLLTGGGFDKSAFGTWSMAMLMVPIIFFICVFANKYLEDYEWNKLGAFLGAFIVYLILISITGAAKWGLAGGIVGMIIGGFVLGFILGGDN